MRDLERQTERTTNERKRLLAQWQSLVAALRALVSKNALVAGRQDILSELPAADLEQLVGWLAELG